MSDNRPQTAYAAVQKVLSTLGFILLAAAFCLYASGALPRTVPPEKVVAFWQLRAHEFGQAAGAANTAWSWLAAPVRGDELCFAALVLLASTTIFSFMVVLFAFLREGNRTYTLLVGLEIIVLVLAALGIGAGH